MGICVYSQEAFDSLSRRTRVRLEHPELTRLYERLVEKGEYGEAEDMIAGFLEGERSVSLK